MQQIGEPPHSTLAAQLVNHLTDGRQHSRNQDKETFRQLLSELLSAESERSSQGQVPDAGDEVDYKLVFVLLRASLDTLIGEEQFSKQSERSKQVIDCLIAVETTLKRSPGVLLIEASGQVPGLDGCGPLFMWFIPKILFIVSRGPIFKENCLRLLQTILCLERKIHGSGIRKHSITKFVKGCSLGQCNHCPLVR